MGKRVAVIDCGTNTFNLLVLEIESKTDWKIIFKTKLAVKIGVGGFSENKIMPERLARALDALASYHATAQSLAVDEVRIFATSAVRESKNGSELVDKVRQLFNWEINVISGDREAELIFEGVNQAVEERFSDYLIMDIGGGSTEFVIVKNNKAIWRKSYLMGVSRIFEWLKPSSRITNDEVLRLKNYCHK
ncbi:MAG: phosphatase, partial [Bacteroidota bacterium]